MENFICNHMGKRYFKHRKYQNLCMNNKVTGDKTFAFSSICAEYLQKVGIFNFPR